MAGMKMMAFAQQLALPESIENAVGDIEQPGAEGKKQRREKGYTKMHGAGEEPRPESGDCRRIQAEQMPPFREIVEAPGQDSVYCSDPSAALGMTKGTVALSFGSLAK